MDSTRGQRLVTLLCRRCREGELWREPLGVNYTSQLYPDKQSHIVCVLSLSFNNTIPYTYVVIVCVMYLCDIMSYCRECLRVLCMQTSRANVGLVSSLEMSDTCSMNGG